MGRCALITRRALAPLLRLFAPGYSACLRCRLPWLFVRPHSTMYSEDRGCFPLCEWCWSSLGTPQGRAPYYAELLASWACSGVDVSELDAALVMSAPFREVARGLVR